jgi:hypothetical protein
LKTRENYQTLGIKIERKPDGTFEWTQPTLTQSILKDLKLDGEEIKGIRQNKPNIKPVPENISVPLKDHKESSDHNPKDFDYRHVMGNLLYLEKSKRPDVSCAVHQCARHGANPKIEHTAAVKRIGRYLLGTKDKGLIMKLNHEGMEYWADAADMLLSGTIKQHHQVQVQQDQGWDTLSLMQDVPCTGHQNFRLR